MHDPDVLVFDIRRPWRDRHGYRPPIVNVWHHEPGGADAGDVCKHWRRYPQPDGSCKNELLTGWRWHVHHYRVQIIPILHLRTLLVDRCAWCQDRHTKANPCNVSVGWDSNRPNWWTTAQGIYHSDCHAAWAARHGCSCEHPVSDSAYGRCAHCNQNLAGRSDLQRQANRLLNEMVPVGTTPTREVMDLARSLWDLHRATQEA